MAGSHQIWIMDVDSNKIAPYAGTRAEARYDGDIENAAFAQPSGIVSDGGNLFVADTESNIIRKIDFEKAKVETLVGGDLWVFGDRDGEGDDVRLQHPLGVEMYDEKVLISDTYNHKIKILDPKSRNVKTLFGTGNSGQIDGKIPTFDEPGGISIANGKLYVADTNNHAIRVVDLESKLTSTLKINGLSSPVEMDDEVISPNLNKFSVAAKEVSPDSETSIIVNLAMPEGFHLNPNAPQRYELKSASEVVKIDNSKQKFKELPLSIPFKTGKSGATILELNLSVYYCREDNTGVCLIKSLAWEIPIKVMKSQSSAKTIKLSAELTQ